MYSTTGFTRRQINNLITLINDMKKSGITINYPPSLGLRTAILITLTYLRRNRTQEDLAETFGTSQSTISRAIASLTPTLAAATADWVPGVEDLNPDVPYVIDGTLLPCWSWARNPELYSGKHHTTGVNVQVACTLSGLLTWVSDPTPGSTHDITAIRATGLLDELTPANLIGDKGYIGTGMITPTRNPPGQELTDDRQAANKEINRIRYVIERTIANLKTWRVLHTDYRRAYHTFAQTISAVVGLQFYKLAS